MSIRRVATLTGQAARNSLDACRSGSWRRLRHTRPSTPVTALRRFKTECQPHRMRYVASRNKVASTGTINRMLALSHQSRRSAVSLIKTSQPRAVMLLKSVRLPSACALQE